MSASVDREARLLTPMTPDPLNDGTSLHVLLVHGVGSTGTDALVDPVRRTIAAADDAVSVEISQFNWNSLVDSPTGRTGMPSYVRNLSDSWRAAATLPRAAMEGRWQKSVLRAFAACRWCVIATVVLLVLGAILQVSGLDNEPRMTASLRWQDFLVPVIDPAVVARSSGTLARLIAIFLAALITIAALGTLLGRPRHCRTRLRHYVLLIVWTVVIPAIHVVLLATIVFGTLAIIVLLIVLIDFYVYFAAASPFSTIGPQLPFFALIGLVATAALIAFVARRTFGPPLKVFADVFHYLGSAGYRRRLLVALAAHIERLPRTTSIYIISHSLGSVIAADSLRVNLETWRRFRRIRLVTMGSPLRRFFTTFFAERFPRPDRLAETFEATFDDFRWVNVFRPLDYVGTRLAAGASRIEERCTRQWWLIIRSHLNYWSDSTVLASVRAALAEAENRTRSRVPIDEQLFVIGDAESVKDVPVARTAAAYAFAVIGVLAIVYRQFVAVPRDEITVRTHVAQVVMRTGLSQPVEVCRKWVDGLGAPDNAHPSTAWMTIGYTTRDSRLPALQEVHNYPVEESELIDASRLSDIIPRPTPLTPPNCLSFPGYVSRNNERLIVIPHFVRTLGSGVFDRVFRCLVLTVTWLVWLVVVTIPFEKDDQNRA